MQGTQWKRAGNLVLRAAVSSGVLFVLFSRVNMAAAASRPSVEAVMAVGMTVSDMDRALAFYTQVLPFQKVSDVEVAGEDFERLEGVFPALARVVHLRLGDEEIVLTDYLTPEGRPIPPDMRSNDASFQHIAIIVSDMDQGYAQLRRAGVQHVSPGPQRLPDWNAQAGGIRAFYFRDPDAHVLEVLWFPPGKGQPRWQSREALFLGIDHTAIVVDDTETSLRLYQATFGLTVMGRSENYGPEQERLNAVFGARLRITTLRAGSGPGIELLEYLAPGDGRPAPQGLRANDLLHWQTTLRVTELQQLEAGLRRDGVRSISPGVISFATGELGFEAGVLVRDPDGHALLLVAGGPVADGQGPGDLGDGNRGKREQKPKDGEPGTLGRH